MKLAQICLVPVLVMAITASGRAAEPLTPGDQDPLVGVWSDSKRVEFTGNKTFTAQQLRFALLSDVSYLLASHPLSPLTSLLPTLETRLTEGYRSAGFSEPQVRATLDETNQRMRVIITEGPRYLSGDIKIIGAVSVPASNLVRRLTETWVPGSSSEGDQRYAGTYLNSAGQKVEKQERLWKPGKPAHFNEAFLQAITDRLTNVLAEAGCFNPVVRPRVVSRPGTALADLYIDLEECGRDIVGRVQVLGLKRNSSGAVLKWLGLASGQAITNDLMGRLERQLWNSARFITYRIVPSPSPDRPEVTDLDLWLEELPEAPLVNDPLSREEQVALKVRDWIVDAPTLGDDVVISASLGDPIGEMELILSGQGALAINRYGGSKRYGLLVGRGRAELHSLLHQRVMAIGHNNSLLVYLSILPSEITSSKSFNIQLGAGATPKAHEAEGSPLEISIALAPVAFIDLVHRTNQTAKFEGNTLALSSEHASLKVDASSGRLLELLVESDDNHAQYRARVERGAFDRKWKEFTTSRAASPDTLANQSGLSTQLAIAAAEAFHLLLLSTNLPVTTTAQRDHAVAAMEKISMRTFASLGSWFATNAVDTNAFSIPVERQLNMTAALAAWAFRYADQFLPVRSWPWTLAHESVFVLAGQSTHTKAELESIYSSAENGPLAFLSTAQLLNLIGSPAAQSFASRGLQRLSPQDFHQDCRLVLDAQTPLGALFHDAARTLRDLPADDLEALTTVLPTQHAVFLRLTVNRLKAEPNRPLAETLTPLLEQLWVSGLRQKVEDSLRAISGESAGVLESQKHFDQGVKANDSKLYLEAARCFRKAAELGMPQAQYVLAQYLEKGLGEARDEAAATHWYHRAASNGVTEAQMALGARYSVDFDKPTDLAEAYYWYSLAAHNGNRVAETLRNGARRKLTPAQLEAVSRRLESDKTSRGR